MKFDVSVVIPLYNRKHLIRYTLECLKPQKHPGVNIEVIVIDDGSSDGGVEFVEQNHPEVKILKQHNAGAPKARNYGLREAKGDYILYLDSDDLVEPDFFREKISTLLKDRKVVGVYSSWEHFRSLGPYDSTTIIPRASYYPIEEIPSSINHLERLVSGWFIPCNAILWRKDVLFEIGGQDETLTVNQDVDLLFKVLIRQYMIKGINSPKALIRDHSVQRVGVVGASSQKLTTIYELRRRFMQELKEQGLWNEKIAEHMARYCLSFWERYRKSHPVESKGFYDIYKEVYPNLKLKGGFIVKLLNLIFNADKIIIIKDCLNKFRP